MFLHVSGTEDALVGKNLFTGDMENANTLDCDH